MLSALAPALLRAAQDAGTQVGARARWWRGDMALAAGGIGLIVLGAGFGLAALFMVIAERFGPVAAALALGAMSFGAGVLVMLIRRRRRPARFRGALALVDPIADRPGGAQRRRQDDFAPLLAAAAVGAAAALQLRRRG